MADRMDDSVPEAGRGTHAHVQDRYQQQQRLVVSAVCQPTSRPLHAHSRTLTSHCRDAPLLKPASAASHPHLST